MPRERVANLISSKNNWPIIRPYWVGFFFSVTCALLCRKVEFNRICGEKLALRPTLYPRFSKLNKTGRHGDPPRSFYVIRMADSIFLPSNGTSCRRMELYRYWYLDCFMVIYNSFIFFFHLITASFNFAPFSKKKSNLEFRNNPAPSWF